MKSYPQMRVSIISLTQKNTTHHFLGMSYKKTTIFLFPRKTIQHQIQPKKLLV